MSKWEVADVQWSPHVSRESWVASTVYMKYIGGRITFFDVLYIVEPKITCMELESLW
jgi:hypothetical protein